MARTKSEQHRGVMKRKILNVAARNFLRYGFTETTIKSITTECNICTGSFNNLYHTKEDVLCELVEFVLNQQFSVADKLIADKTNDKLLFYAVETTLQLYIVESSEKLRDVYSAAYSLPKTSAIIQKVITGKWESVFKEYHPEYQTKDFFILEVATGGIMRGFMTIPCDMWFTMDQKVESFLECTFKMYDIPKEKIQQAIDFVKQFDFKEIVKQTLDGIFKYLETEAE